MSIDALYYSDEEDKKRNNGEESVDGCIPEHSDNDGSEQIYCDDDLQSDGSNSNCMIIMTIMDTIWPYFR